MSGRITPFPPPYHSAKRPLPPPYSVADQSSSSVDSAAGSNSSSLPRGPFPAPPARPVYVPERWAPDPPARNDTNKQPKRKHGVECCCIAFLVVSLALVSLILAISASVRFANPCFSKGEMHCDIPECQCGTPQQKPQCQNFPPIFFSSVCTAEKLQKYERSGGNVYTWQLAVAACIVLWVALVVSCASYARTCCVVDQSPRHHIVDGKRMSPAEYACGGIVALGVYVFVAALVGISIFIGVVLARQEVDDVVNLAVMVQWLLYLGIVFVLFSSPFLGEAYRMCE